VKGRIFVKQYYFVTVLWNILRHCLRTEMNLFSDRCPVFRYKSLSLHETTSIWSVRFRGEVYEDCCSWPGVSWVYVALTELSLTDETKYQVLHMSPCNSTVNSSMTECHDRGVCTPAPCSEYLAFKSRPGDRISWRSFYCGLPQELQVNSLIVS
jgi:hypothetical protein